MKSTYRFLANLHYSAWLIYYGFKGIKISLWVKISLYRCLNPKNHRVCIGYAITRGYVPWLYYNINCGLVVLMEFAIAKNKVPQGNAP